MEWDIAQRATGFGPVGYAAQADAVLDRIRARAAALWDQAGRPDGGPSRFWLQAEAEVVDEISLRE